MPKIEIDKEWFPAVTTKMVHGHNYLEVDGKTYSDELSAAEWKESAIRRLAISQYLDRQEQNALDAEQKARAVKELAYNKRRDELAAELAPRFDPALDPNWYANVGRGLQRAIDRIIELEDASPKLPEF